MSDFSSRWPIKDYYREAQSLRTRPPPCPYCGKPGRAATNWYEVGKRLPLIMAEGVATCGNCHGLAQSADEVLRGDRIWYCVDCGICLCTNCQRKLKRS